MTTAEKKFMEKTIEAHNLFKRQVCEVTNLTPSREEDYSLAKELADNTNYFERRGYILEDRNAPAGDYTKSFSKWLSLHNERNVKAVISLYEWKKAVRLAEMELSDEIYDLEQMTTSPALQVHMEKLLERKEEELRALCRLQSNIADVIYELKNAPVDYKERKTA